MLFSTELLKLHELLRNKILIDGKCLCRLIQRIPVVLLFFSSNALPHAVVKFDVISLSLISGKTHTLMAPDGITAGVIERCFKRITLDDRHDYKVQQ